MTETRKSIANLIEQLRQNEMLIDQLPSPVFVSVAAELFAQNKHLVEVQRNARDRVDVFAKIQDSLGSVQTIAIEVQQLSHQIDAKYVQGLRDRIARMNVDKIFLVTNSYFTEASKRAAQSIISLELIDRSGLKSLLEQYRSNQELFASNLFQQLQNINPVPLIEIPDPNADQVEEIDPTNIGLSEPQRSTLVSVESLPFRLVAIILRKPDEVKNLTPRQFEEFVAEILAQLGFKDVILTPRSRDGSKDVIASNEINGIPLSFYFECKQYAYSHKVQLETLRALLGTLSHEAPKVNKGVLVTTSTFTKAARKFILGEARLDGKDYDGILGWIGELRKTI